MFTGHKGKENILYSGHGRKPSVITEESKMRPTRGESGKDPMNELHPLERESNPLHFLVLSTVCSATKVTYQRH